MSALREDLFCRIENLSHGQLSEIPVGKLVTRVTNDTGAISMMFTGLLANLVQNMFVILGVLIAMFVLNVPLTLLVLCFAPFIVLFTVIFRKFSRKAYRRVKESTTDINTYLSEHLSGMKIIQIFNRESKKPNSSRKRTMRFTARGANRFWCSACSDRWFICFTFRRCFVCSIFPASRILTARDLWAR